MSLLEDLIGKPRHEISDEELDDLVTKGRLAREADVSGSKKRSPAKPKASAASAISDEDLEMFD